MAEAKKPEAKPAAAPKAEPTNTAPEATPAHSGAKTNGMAVVALVLAILSLFVSWVFLFGLVGLILGIVAKGQIKKKGEGGKGMATAAIIISVISLILGVIVIGAFIGFAYFAKDQAKKNGVDLDTGSINVKGKDGESLSIGNAKLPDGFPSDVPIYTSSKITASSKFGNDKYTVILTTGDSVSKVQDFYKTQLASKGWTSDGNTGSYSFESGTIATFNKGTQQLLVTISSTNKGGDDNTGISLTVYPKNYNN